jgi:DnaJ-class molecular chaperone
MCRGDKTLYELLGLDAFASEKAIKQTFRKLSLKYHPDKQRSDEARASAKTQYDAIRRYSVFSHKSISMLHAQKGNFLIFLFHSQRL